MIASGLPVGAVVTAVPENCQQVVVDGTLYYLINGVTYMRTAYGYQVVPMPSVLVPRMATMTAPVTVSGPLAVGTDGGRAGATSRVRVSGFCGVQVVSTALPEPMSLNITLVTVAEVGEPVIAPVSVAPGTVDRAGIAP